MISDLNFSYTYFVDKNVKTETTTGSLLEHYRYNAFVEPEIYSPQTKSKLVGSASANPVLWSSRRYEEQTELYYYKYRDYKADIGRWLGICPIEEDGGVNLYGFVRNRSLNDFDITIGVGGEAEKHGVKASWGATIDYKDEKFPAANNYSRYEAVYRVSCCEKNVASQVGLAEPTTKKLGPFSEAAITPTVAQK